MNICQMRNAVADMEKAGCPCSMWATADTRALLDIIGRLVALLSDVYDAVEHVMVNVDLSGTIEERLYALSLTWADAIGDDDGTDR